MEATDLMIGDWVLISVWGCKPFPSKVTLINYNSYQGKDFVDWIDTEDEEEIGMYNVQPIPLTSEILEKNGWCLDEIDGSYRHHDNGFWIGGRNAPFGILVSNLYQDIKYVHELQHALKLCKIEKEIQL